MTEAEPSTAGPWRDAARALDPSDPTEPMEPVEPAVIARVLLAPGTVVEVLDRIVTLAVGSIDGCDAAGLCSGVGPFEELPSTPLAARLEQLQEALGEGPCVDVRHGSDGMHWDSLVDDLRWPRFGPVADAAGVRSGVCYRVFSGAETLAALHLHSTRPAAFDLERRAQALLFAVHAGFALATARYVDAVADVQAQMQAALHTREVIGQAQGILMERERITAAKAFEVLRTASQQLNVKLRVVAQALVDMGDLPDASDLAGRVPESPLPSSGTTRQREDR